jgi:hypothetical protein
MYTRISEELILSIFREEDLDIKLMTAFITGFQVLPSNIA